jgi:hypothetical protein
MNLRWTGPLALLAVLVIADQVRINRPGHKYRVTVEVETPEGIKWSPESSRFSTRQGLQPQRAHPHHG